MAGAAEEKGSGGDALAGLDHQIDISVWLALDLSMASQDYRCPPSLSALYQSRRSSVATARALSSEKIACPDR